MASSHPPDPRGRKPAGDRAHTPIVAITAGVSETERADCISAGMTFVLGKPFTGESLRRAMLPPWVGPSHLRCEAD